MCIKAEEHFEEWLKWVEKLPPWKLELIWTLKQQFLKINNRNWMSIKTKYFIMTLSSLYTSCIRDSVINLPLGFGSFARPFFKDLQNDIIPYLQQNDKITKKEFLNISNLLKHCQHRIVNKQS